MKKVGILSVKIPAILFAQGLYHEKSRGFSTQPVRNPSATRPNLVEKKSGHDFSYLVPFFAQKRSTALQLWIKILYWLYAARALALMRSMMLFTPIHTVKSVNTSTILPLSVNGASCRTERSFIRPLWTMYSTIWFTK